MVYFIDKELNIYNQNPLISLPKIEGTYLISDTEFTKNKEIKKLLVDCVGIYLPNITKDFLVIFSNEELTPEFHPLHSTLKVLGYSIDFADEDNLIDIIGKIQTVFEECVDCSKSTREVKKEFKSLNEEGYFDHYLAELNVSSECLTLEKDKSTDSYVVNVKPPKIPITTLFFYGFADLFKIWGKEHQHLLLNSNLVQQRCLKLRNAYGSETPLTEYVMVDGELHEFQYSLRETMYRFPPRSKGLDAQTSIFEVDTKKINVKTRLIADALGFKNVNEVMENFSHFLKKLPDEALKYHAIDIFATYDLNLKQQEFYNIILQTFQLENIEVSDTTGSNVSKFIVECIKKEFNIYDKQDEKLVREIINLSGLENLEESPLNDYGCQPFLTVGGLLYSRMALTKFIKGYLSDCDLKSCYASFMSMMNVYLGEPITLTCKYDKYKITLKEALELIENQQTPHDAWFVRISGKLDKAINTLVMSDLKFKPKNLKQQSLYEVNSNRKSIEKFNAFKTSKRQAQSTILTKEIKFGIITKSTIEALKKLPTEWFEEYLNLKCDVVCFYPGDLIADNLNDYLTIRESLPDHDRIERIDIKKGAKGIDSQRYKNNACLRFPIHKYWLELKTNRNKFKKAKNPIQEVFKLFQNSGYGVLACLYLTTNNLMASNQITAAARSGAWLMTNALNGFGSITDGTSYSWEHIPLGKTFHEILASNPIYLEHFDESIQSKIEITSDFKFQEWCDKNLTNHMASFYQVNALNDYNLQQFEYELKTENFLTKKGQDWFKEKSEKIDELKNELGTSWEKYLLKNGYMVETPLFTKFYNNNAGNYCKGIDGGEILIEGEEYNIIDNEPFVKARSFQGGDENLIKWYTSAIENQYKIPLIYKENKLIKFGDGNLLAIRFLESGSEKIAHPMGFDTVGYKMMKLITRSQFLFQSEVQLRNFETNEVTLAELSKELGLNQKTFWDNLKAKDIESYDIELRENIDYFSYAKTHPTGIGFELLALSPSANGDINQVRRQIVELINNGCKNFNAALNLKRNIKYASHLKNLFAAVIIAKKNAEDDLRKLLENSASEPTIFTVSQENIRRLHEFTNNSTEDE